MRDPNAPTPKIEPGKLAENYRDWMGDIMGPEGFSMPYGLILSADGKLTVNAMAVPPERVHSIMLLKVLEDDPAEVVWALDRYAKPGQGLIHNDLLAGLHYIRGGTAAEAFRPFIIEYRYEPRVIEPIDYGNAHWCEVLRREVLSTLANLRVRFEREIANDPA